MMKTAIILFNLGGPDRLEAVRPFLFNLFNDPAILRLPKPFRFLLAKLIAGKREQTARAIYAKLGGGSPILPNTQQQAKALERNLGVSNAKCFIAMRYWHPFVEEIIDEVKSYAPEQIILLPLYPQFSTTSTGSSLASWQAAAEKARLNLPTKIICCYPEEPGFIAALAEKIRASYVEAEKHGKPRVLFSAHGLPEKIVKDGDPYPQQCEETVAALRRILAIDGLDSMLCYQSRVGPLKWIGPATDDEIRRAGQDKVPLVMAPIAFVSEHSETLVEIDMEYRHLATASGVPFYLYTGTVSDDARFINGLADLVRATAASERACMNDAGRRHCADTIAACPFTKQTALPAMENAA